MDCLICGANAEQIPTTIDDVSIVCPTCGEYDVASAVVATGQLQKLEPDQRGDVLDKARRSAQPAARPVITPYLLAARTRPSSTCLDNGGRSYGSWRSSPTMVSSPAKPYSRRVSAGRRPAPERAEPGGDRDAQRLQDLVTNVRINEQSARSFPQIPSRHIPRRPSHGTDRT